MKRLLAILFSLVMAFSLVTVSVMAAENTPTVTVETAANAVDAGSEVSLEVSIKDNTGFTNYEWNIHYDKTRLELKSINGNVVSVANPNHKDTGFGYATYANAVPYTQDGNLLTLNFMVKENAESGKAEVKIVSNNFSNDPNPVEVSYIDGGVTVNGSTTGGSTTGGSTTGGSTTGGSTTGGSTTGGGTTGGGTTGGGSTGGGSTGGGSSSGSGSSYTSGMSFTTDLPADSITRVTVNGKKLDSKYYTVSSNGSGSIVTLTDAYLATLKAGTYTIKIESATHVSTGTFTIKADGTPKTADAGIALYAVMAVSSLMGTAVVSKKCRKA